MDNKLRHPLIILRSSVVQAPRSHRRQTGDNDAAPSILDPDDPSTYTRGGGGGDDDDDHDDDSTISERLSLVDSLLFPLLGSVALGGLYLALKFAGEVWVNRVMGLYCESKRRRERANSSCMCDRRLVIGWRIPAQPSFRMAIVSFRWLWMA